MRLPIRIAHGSLYAGFIMPPPQGAALCVGLRVSVRLPSRISDFFEILKPKKPLNLWQHSAGQE